MLLAVFHQTKSAILHWDDNIRHNQIERFTSSFLIDSLSWSKDITVHIIGGWEDHPESKKSGDFLKNYFGKLSIILNLEGFQQKKI